MGKRFSRLKYALRTLQTPSGTSNNEPASGSVLAKYKDFRDGKIKATYPRREGSDPGSLSEVKIQAFGFAVDGTPVKVKVSARAIASGGVAAGVKTAAGINDDPAGAIDIDGFIPAKATIFRKSATQSTTKKTSQITGLQYDPTNGVSFTIPYGQKTGTTNESAVRTEITNEIGEDEKVSFTSEKL